MDEAKLAVNFFVALFALIDPIGNVPLFAAATLGAAAAGRRMVVEREVACWTPATGWTYRRSTTRA